MFKLRIGVLWIGLWLALLSSCSQNSRTEQSSVATDSLAQKPPLLKKNRYWNDLARYLAGMPPEKNSLLDSAEYRPEALQHIPLIEEKWRSKQVNLLNPMVHWAENEMPQERKWTGEVFYPFSGPDFVTIYNFFPHAKKYTLFGLEIEGNLFDIKQVGKDRMAANLANLRRSIEPIMSVSFFYTLDMSRDLYASDMKGTLPILLLFIARTGNEVLDVQRFKLTPDGATEYLPANDSLPQISGERKPPETNHLTGVEITFRKNENAPIQTLHYLCLNAHDGHLTKVDYPIKFIQRLKPSVTYLKAASYLLHNHDFSLMRNAVLGVSQSLLQDDTGIAFRYFDKKQWSFFPYGGYTPPIPIFRSYHQPSLDSLYQSASNVKPIDFGLGYKCGWGPTNLLLARKANTTPPVVAP